MGEWIYDKEDRFSVHEAAMKYIEIHKKILTEYEKINIATQFPPKPMEMDKINMTFLQFIKKHKLDALIPYFLYKLSLFEGYGALDELPAFYGLLWNNTRSIRSDLLSTKYTKQNLWCLRKGFLHLLENMIDAENIRIEYNTEITSINRYLNDEKHKICLMYINDEDTEKLVECDVLFCASNISLLTSFISDITEEEQRVFGSMSARTLCATLFECDVEQTQHEKLAFYPNNLLSNNEEEEGHLFKLNNSSKILNGEKKHHKIIRDKGLKREKLIGYQMMNKDPDFVDISFEDILLNDLQEIGLENVKIIKQNIMRVFPEWSQQDINDGVPWLVKDKLQGKYKNMYYIGSSVGCCQSIEAMLEYNIQLQHKLHFA